MSPEDHLKAGDPEAALAALQAKVRADASDPKLRVFLFQLLCVLGDWKRAIAQLKLCAELDAGLTLMARTYREAIICGEGVAVPIRVALDNLEPQRRPASNDPSFTDLWRQSGGEADILARTITRWRSQGR